MTRCPITKVFDAGKIANHALQTSTKLNESGTSEPYDLLFIEDSIAPELVDQYARIRQHVSVPLAAGERMSSLWGMKNLIERELVDVIQPDTGRAGGLNQMKKIAAIAEAHGTMLAPHSGSLGPVAEFAALHPMASLPNALMIERVENDWQGPQ